MKKIRFTLILFVLILFGFSVDNLATTVTEESSGISQDVLDLYYSTISEYVDDSYPYIYLKSNNYQLLLTIHKLYRSSFNSSYDSNYATNNYFYFSDGDTSDCVVSKYYVFTSDDTYEEIPCGYLLLDNDNNILAYKQIDTSKSEQFTKSLFASFVEDVSSYYTSISNVEVTAYYNDTETSVFQYPPSMGLALLTVEQVQEVPTTIVQAMKILIPVGLVIFGIGLLIYLIRLVISRVQ